MLISLSFADFFSFVKMSLFSISPISIYLDRLEVFGKVYFFLDSPLFEHSQSIIISQSNESRAVNKHRFLGPTRPSFLLSSQLIVTNHPNLKQIPDRMLTLHPKLKNPLQMQQIHRIQTKKHHHPLLKHPIKSIHPQRQVQQHPLTTTQIQRTKRKTERKIKNAQNDLRSHKNGRNQERSTRTPRKNTSWTLQQNSCRKLRLVSSQPRKIKQNHRRISRTRRSQRRIHTHQRHHTGIAKHLSTSNLTTTQRTHDPQNGRTRSHQIQSYLLQPKPPQRSLLLITDQKQSTAHENKSKPNDQQPKLRHQHPLTLWIHPRQLDRAPS